MSLETSNSSIKRSGANRSQSYVKKRGIYYTYIPISVLGPFDTSQWPERSLILVMIICVIRVKKSSQVLRHPCKPLPVDFGYEFSLK